MANINDGWHNMVRDKKNDITIDQRKSAAGLLTMRASGHINYRSINIWRCINYNEWRKQWDANCDAIYFMGKQGVGAYSMYNRSKRIMVVAEREFILDFFTFQDEKDDTIFIIISSNDELEGPPKKKGVVSANAPIGGWVIVPDKENPNRTFCTLMIELDFGGYMPEIAVKTAFRDQGYQINLLKKTMPKFIFKNGWSSGT